jgi:cobalamin biosynthesis protein CobD/CbiB
MAHTSLATIPADTTVPTHIPVEEIAASLARAASRASSPASPRQIQYLAHLVHIRLSGAPYYRHSWLLDENLTLDNKKSSSLIDYYRTNLLTNDA